VSWKGLIVAGIVLERAGVRRRLLSIKTSTVYELSRRRRDPLPFVRIGRSKRFDRRAIARRAEAHANG
jgi:hypothetical protein